MISRYPWTIDQTPNLAISDERIRYYTLRWNGLVRGQIVGLDMAEFIVAQLNLANLGGEIESPVGRFA